MEARIAEDGEILLRGPWIFQGYLKNPEATSEALEGGWLHTGDIGAIDEAGFLRLTDRKKHLIITAGGKNLSPANIENAIKCEDPLVSQVYAHGDRRPYVIALVAPSPLETLAWGRDRGILPAGEVASLSREILENPVARSAALNAAMAKVVADPAFGERIREAVRKGNHELAHVEQVRRFAVLGRDFSQEAGELTPTMKLKRKAVVDLHGALLESVYEGGGIEVSVRVPQSAPPSPPLPEERGGLPGASSGGRGGEAEGAAVLPLPPLPSGRGGPGGVGSACCSILRGRRPARRLPRQRRRRRRPDKARVVTSKRVERRDYPPDRPPAPPATPRSTTTLGGLPMRRMTRAPAEVTRRYAPPSTGPCSASRATR